jgi:hypothetical protein
VEKIKDNYYFQAFVSLSNYSLQASKFLDEIVSNFRPDYLSIDKEGMHRIEHEADMERHHVLSVLYKEFITPIELEDILSLLSSIDDVTDAIEDIVLKMYMYNVKALRPDMKSFTDIISKCCISLKALLEEFSHFKKSNKMKDLIQDVLKLEEDCDVVYAEAVHNLFVNEKDPVSILIWEDLYLRMENCCDACGYVSKVIERAIFKNM